MTNTHMEEENYMRDAIAFTAREKHEQLEGYIELHIKKRPWWMPKFVYQKLLNLLFEMGHFKKY